MKRFLKHVAIASVLACGISAAQADVVLFNEGFQGLPGGQYSAPAPIGSVFFVQGGSIDVLDTGFFGSLCTNAAGAVNCLDLIGGFDAVGGTLSSVQFFGAGNYKLSFQLAGSQRGDTNTTTVFFGDQIAPFTPLSDADFSTFDVFATVIAPSRVTFFTPGSDASGNLLDNVSLTLLEPTGTPVPEPSALFLLATGLIAAAATRRRKTKA
jgi:hypothetical protein